MVTADAFLRLPLDERKLRLGTLSLDELEFLMHDWTFWARENQRMPGKNPRTADGSWTTWLIKAGRGYGKTRVGAETVRAWIKNYEYVNLVGATADDARDIMIEGESGILAICPKDERPEYLPSKRRLEWPNGAKSLIFTADEPERLRGKQHMKAWGDEVAAWRYRDAWDQLMMGLRLGDCPQCIATTTPKPTELIKEIVADPTTVVTHGTTYENRSNLAPAFFDRVIKKYEGTRLGRQELNAELLEDNPGALWTRKIIDKSRVERMPETLRRVVVGVDPAVTANADSDETGIIVGAVDFQNPPHYYIIDDKSQISSVDTWAKASVVAYRVQKGDCIVGEVNNGGDLVEAVIRNVTIDDKPVGRNVKYKAVHASRGKAIRAEPISGLYEQGRVHHVGSFTQLEDQMCDWDPLTGTDSPDRLDALVWCLTELSEGTGGSMQITPELLARL